MTAPAGRGRAAAASSVVGAATAGTSRAPSPSRYGRSGGDGIPFEEKFVIGRPSKLAGANVLFETTCTGGVA
ncbi:MAG: hypothetical protein WAU99_23295, partial [Pseudolabrys sp.]